MKVIHLASDHPALLRYLVFILKYCFYWQCWYCCRCC